MVLVGLIVFAVAAAAVAAFTLARSFVSFAAGAYRHVAVMEASGADVFALVMQSGCRPFLPFGDFLASRSFASDYVRDLDALFQERSGLSLGEAVLLSWVMAASLTVCLASWLISASLACGLACACCFVAVCVGAAKAASDRRAEKIRESVPTALRAMGVCFRAGFSLQQTLKQVCEEVEGPLGAVFASAAYTMDAGGSVEEALELMRRKSQSPELAFVCAALSIQHLIGGSLGPVLESARESVQSDIDLKRSLRVQTSQARLSARIVTVMPFLLISVFSLVSEGFLDPFFASAAGLALLCLALLMQLVGVLLVRRTLDVGVG